ncbi:hypothetical protein NBT05_03465 [Aquimarina sp. ERC-38]|uniref:hypothetical protein n=1 Tax=Aquimarina sp. ERC-38 TaxID=2949996 RepID=UPI002247BCFD|nr:hypothetical protein [Aquimarina sp. ERC-38]UZO81539.1 hypothetical protein NBT05_03465 [Aquimarina sp. ERC-38]
MIQNILINRIGISIIILGVFFSSLTSYTKIEAKVYICKGKGSKRYHYRQSCRGLSRCSSGIYKVSLQEAKQIGRTLCGWED